MSEESSLFWRQQWVVYSPNQEHLLGQTASARQMMALTVSRLPSPSPRGPPTASELVRIIKRVIEAAEQGRFSTVIQKVNVDDAAALVRMGYRVTPIAVDNGGSVISWDAVAGDE